VSHEERTVEQVSSSATQPDTNLNGPKGNAVSTYLPSAEPSRFESIEELFLALELPLLAYSRRLLADDETAQDMVQEAFMRLHRHFGEVRRPRPWLYRTVHNLALNHRRKTGCTNPIPDASSPSPDGPPPAVDPADPQPLPDEQIARLEGIGQVRLGLANLDARSQELLRLKFHEDCSYQQISERTGLTVGHVGYLLHHALKALAVELAKSGVTP
jgi:RNA polymerase sigma factor (sigma-70 family)